MKRTAVILVGLSISLVGCDDDSSEAAEARDQPGETPTGAAPEPPESAEPAAPTGPDRDLVERYLEDSEQGPHIDVDAEITREIDDQVLADFDLRTRGYMASSRQSQLDLTIQDLDELSESEKLEVCAAISAHLADGPDAMDSAGPVLLLLSADVEDEETGQRTHSVLVYNDTIWPPDSAGDCAVL